MSNQPGNVNKLSIVKPYEEYPKHLGGGIIVHNAEEEAAASANASPVAAVEANTEHAAEANEVGATDTAVTEETVSEPLTKSRSRRKKKKHAN